MEAYCVSCRKNTGNKALIVKIKIRWNRLMLISNCVVCDKKNGLSLKIKNSTILIVFEMINLKWIKSWTNFYWMETDLHQNCI